MCGIAAIIGGSAGSAGAAEARALDAMLDAMAHRGPDARGTWRTPGAGVELGQVRLAIIDLSPDGRQPMASPDGRLQLVFNGEIYNYLELRAELAAGWSFRTRTDVEVILAAYERWGEACLDRFIGMFAFVLWDARAGRVFAARDRFGVKPLYRGRRLADGALVLASEIKALFAAGVPAEADPVAWATYLGHGRYDHSARTFWRGVENIPAGCALSFAPGEDPAPRRWYDLAARVGPELDARPDAEVRAEVLSLLEDSVRLRFRADVPVGINLSGGLDSSTLMGLVQRVQGADSDVKAFSFTTGDAAYDELPWVREALSRTRHPLVECRLTADEVPALAERILAVQDEPYGGLPTLAYAKLFARARAEGVIVLLDGQGIDEAWAGYDYYRKAGATATSAPTVQGTTTSPVRPDCLAPAFLAAAESAGAAAGLAAGAAPFPDALRNLQLRDALETKIPRALRFNDRVSMASSTELREPFLDHRLFELALRQPPARKLGADTGKKLVRELAAELTPDGVRLAPKRPLQTPQREWLAGPLRPWVEERLEAAFARHAAWFDVPAARAAWKAYLAGAADNSFWVWQWVTLGMTPRRPS